MSIRVQRGMFGVRKFAIIGNLSKDNVLAINVFGFGILVLK